MIEWGGYWGGEWGGDSKIVVIGDLTLYRGDIDRVDENYLTNDIFKATLVDPPVNAYDVVVTDAEYIPQDDVYWNPYNLYPAFPLNITQQSSGDGGVLNNTMKFNLSFQF